MIQFQGKNPEAAFRKAWNSDRKPRARKAKAAPVRIKDWSYQNDVFFSDAIQAMREDIHQGTSFEGSLSHYSDLFQIEESALRHEWNLRNEDDR